MNHIYKVIFNKATNTFTAVAENAKGQSKSSKGSSKANSQSQSATQMAITGSTLPSLFRPALLCLSISLAFTGTSAWADGGKGGGIPTNNIGVSGCSGGAGGNRSGLSGGDGVNGITINTLGNSGLPVNSFNTNLTVPLPVGFKLNMDVAFDSIDVTDDTNVTENITDITKLCKSGGGASGAGGGGSTVKKVKINTTLSNFADASTNPLIPLTGMQAAVVKPMAQPLVNNLLTVEEDIVLAGAGGKGGKHGESGSSISNTVNLVGTDGFDGEQASGASRQAIEDNKFLIPIVLPVIDSVVKSQANNMFGVDVDLGLKNLDDEDVKDAMFAFIDNTPLDGLGGIGGGGGGEGGYGLFIDTQLATSSSLNVTATAGDGGHATVFAGHGGDGGVGVALSKGGELVVGKAVKAGDGGDGGIAIFSGHGGGGGTGILLSEAGELTINESVTGGNGGDGGEAAGFDGGTGGDGGTGILLSKASELTINKSVTGGNGGKGSHGAALAFYYDSPSSSVVGVGMAGQVAGGKITQEIYAGGSSGRGGDGGHGVELSEGGTVTVGATTVSGGDGRESGSVFAINNTKISASGDGGDAIHGKDLTVILQESSILKGGEGAAATNGSSLIPSSTKIGTAGAAGNAIAFNGGINKLVLEDNVTTATGNITITGDIVDLATTPDPTQNTLALGGVDATGSKIFDVAELGTDTGKKFGIFGTYAKENTGTWELKNTGTSSGSGSENWDIMAGEVVVGSLANSSTNLTGEFTVFDTATLSGSGSVGSLVTNSGGIVSPGNATDDINTLTVTGDFTHNGTLLADVDLTSKTADTINVDGELKGTGQIQVKRIGGDCQANCVN